jgi:hypothetical protein
LASIPATNAPGHARRQSTCPVAGWWNPENGIWG